MSASFSPAIQWDTCAEIARNHGRSFFFASKLLPPESRRAVLAAYAYCRIADDIVDTADGNLGATEERLAQWESELDEPVHPVAVAFAVVRDQYAIPDRPVRELFDGMRADLRFDRFATWSELRGYCHQVAGTVGLIVAPILGCRDPSALPRAAELGIAMQLTNILRDVGEDAAMGRIYLPLDELAWFGVDPDCLANGQPGPGFQELMRFQMQRSRELYANALTAVPALSWGGRLATLTAAKLYSGILDQIESNDFEVFGRRAVLSRAKKAKRSAGAIWQFSYQLGSRKQWSDPSPVIRSPANPPATRAEPNRRLL
jgi:phytoene synthase